MTYTYHKHHSSHHAAGVLIGVIMIGSVIGSVNGAVGNTIATSANALNGEGSIESVDRKRQWRIFDQASRRKLRRTKRMQRSERVVRDVGVTYPMKTNSFGDHIASRKWDVALNTGFFSYPRLGIGAPINKPSITNWKNRDWRALENQMQYGLLHGVTAYPHSPLPGGNGNVILAGHSSAPTLEAMGSDYENVFANLPKSQVGDRIEVRDDENNAYTYEVYRTDVISARYTQILLQDPKKRDLVMFTCYPIGTTRERFAVWAKLVEEEIVATR